jgi:hypothetical protein
MCGLGRLLGTGAERQAVALMEHLLRSLSPLAEYCLSIGRFSRTMTRINQRLIPVEDPTFSQVMKCAPPTETRYCRAVRHFWGGRSLTSRNLLTEPWPKSDVR